MVQAGGLAEEHLPGRMVRQVCSTRVLDFSSTLENQRLTGRFETAHRPASPKRSWSHSRFVNSERRLVLQGMETGPVRAREAVRSYALD